MRERNEKKTHKVPNMALKATSVTQFIDGLSAIRCKVHVAVVMDFVFLTTLSPLELSFRERIPILN